MEVYSVLETRIRIDGIFDGRSDDIPVLDHFSILDAEKIDDRETQHVGRALHMDMQSDEIIIGKGTNALVNAFGESQSGGAAVGGQRQKARTATRRKHHTG